MKSQSKSYAFLLIIVLFIVSGTFNKSMAQNFQKKPINQLILPDKNEINFVWLSDSVGEKLEPHSALLIPVKIADCPKQFYMQFDLGSSYSMFYDAKINAIKSKYPKNIHTNDSLTKLSNLHFTIGKNKIIANDIFLKKLGNPKINWNDKKSIEIIGTFGVDFIQNKTLTINYPEKKILIQDLIPEKLISKITLADFMFVQNSILLPTVIKGKKTMLYFDTGSSAYELLTNKETCTLLAEPNTESTQYKVKSWDKFLIANTFITKEKIEIAGLEMPLNKVTYIDGASNSQIDQMMKMGMGGMTGNKLFLNHILFIDIKMKKFGVLKVK
ncbi:hypothetical protein [Flavobacterium sp.]|uniref:hypothetical protein n=1 Tax=Flavobacterium sp. TaxID=239 RepID=UPI00286E7FC9|nr:hypothetical protein [Flavobacterium sp.]